MINKFQGEYRWLSNFEESPIEQKTESTLHGSITKIYKSVEHFYQSHKAVEEEDHEKIRLAVLPRDAKRLGSAVTLRADWEKVRMAIMFQGLIKKFSIPELATRLIQTGNQNLIEGNTWGDKFWGMDSRTFEGENHLGRMLMQIRTTLQKNQSRITISHVYDGEFALLYRKDDL